MKELPQKTELKEQIRALFAQTLAMYDSMYPNAESDEEKRTKLGHAMSHTLFTLCQRHNPIGIIGTLAGKVDKFKEKALVEVFPVSTLGAEDACDFIVEYSMWAYLHVPDCDVDKIKNYLIKGLIKVPQKIRSDLAEDIKARNIAWHQIVDPNRIPELENAQTPKSNASDNANGPSINFVDFVQALIEHAKGSTDAIVESNGGQYTNREYAFVFLFCGAVAVENLTERQIIRAEKLADPTAEDEATAIAVLMAGYVYEKVLKIDQEYSTERQAAARKHFFEEYVRYFALSYQMLQRLRTGAGAQYWLDSSKEIAVALMTNFVSLEYAFAIAKQSSQFDRNKLPQQLCEIYWSLTPQVNQVWQLRA